MLSVVLDVALIILIFREVIIYKNNDKRIDKLKEESDKMNKEIRKELEKIIAEDGKIREENEKLREIIKNID
ncbi:hypothetical protein [Clostridium massiliamazoniense]|uniref:hypothetical protein n=1 Tax=Clostridium massiliamazoniense TaxID=1347366 RepID=UPI0006D7F842|nr:hypothetical protein [Clostridium massiliamazoniense]